MAQIGAIFDMDGVIVDNSTFHFLSWQEACKRHGIELSESYYQRELNGRPMKAILSILFGENISEEEGKKFEQEKEALYREMYQPHIKPTTGLIDFLHSLRAANIISAVGTSAPPENVDFTLDHTRTRDFFKGIIDASMVRKGKPDPEVYLKAADLLNLYPHQCMVFEDAIMGVKAGKAAGMKVIGLATTHKATDLQEADLVVNHFADLNLSIIRKLMKN